MRAINPDQSPPRPLSEMELRRKYLQEPWGKLARQCGLDPVHTESQARMVLKDCAEKLVRCAEDARAGGMLIAIAESRLHTDIARAAFDPLIEEFDLSYQEALRSALAPSRNWAMLQAVFEEETAEYAYVDEVPDYGDLMTREEWIADCNAGALIDSDGDGRPAMQKSDGTIRVSELCIWPSMRHALPATATHVVWFNK